MKYIGALVGIFCLLYLGQFASDSFRTRGTIYSKIDSGWRIEVAGKTLTDVHLPYRLDDFSGRKSGSRASLSNTIDLPKNCLQARCYLFFGELGDLVEVYLNGRLVRSQGYADGAKSLAKHYPLWVEVPEGVSNSISIRLEIESLYGSGFGLTKGPLFVGDYAAIRSTERAMTLQTSTFPLMQALVLSILGIFALFIWSFVGLNRTVYSFGIFTLVQAAFMLSFSFLPREFLPVTTASALHFTLRLLSDWALFELLSSMLTFNRRLVIGFRLGFFGFLISFIALYFNGAGYPAFVLSTQIAGVLILGVPVLSLVVAIQRFIASRDMFVRQSYSLKILIPTLLVLTVFQAWDTAVFWGMVVGPYLVKFYLAPLALTLAIVLVKRHVGAFNALKQSQAEAEKDAVFGRLALEFSHDLKSPLAALRDAARIAKVSDDSDFKDQFYDEVIKKTEAVTTKIQTMCNYARAQVQDRKLVSLLLIIDEVKEELSSQIKAKNLCVNIDLEITSAYLDADSFKRAVLNLMDNAIAASSDGGRIELKSRLIDKRLIFSVQDYGIGIPEEHLPMIFEPYFTKNKPNGNGLGLAFVDRISRQHDGFVQVYSKVNHGTTLVMEIPQ